MIIANLKGGLGNQLFQIAAGVAVAKQLNTDFAINYNLQHNCIQGFNPAKYKNTLYRNIPSTDHIPQSVYQEPHFHYSQIKCDKDCIIDGYFQSLKYFERYADEIRSLFCFPESSITRSIKVSNIAGDSVTGVHIRRGDYKTYSNIHYLQPKEYYNKAINLLSYNKIVVATDDWKTFYEEKLLSDFEDTHTIFSTGGCSEVDDLCILSNCNNIVMSNSSLAWWAAFLGKKKETVIAPSMWFGPDGPQDYYDIYKENWIII